MIASNRSAARAAIRKAWVIGLLVAGVAAQPARATGDDERLDRLPDRERERVERLRNATPEERDAWRESMREELRDASPRERRRLLRRERRLMSVLPEGERETIREENRAFRSKHGKRSRQAARDLVRELELDPEERRALRVRLRELPRRERRALWRDIQGFRELPAEERAALEARLLELKALGEADRAVVRENARRWSEMSEARRQRLRAQWKKLRALPPDERADLLDRAFEARSQDEATPP